MECLRDMSRGGGEPVHSGMKQLASILRLGEAAITTPLVGRVLEDPTRTIRVRSDPHCMPSWPGRGIGIRLDSPGEGDIMAVEAVRRPANAGTGTRLACSPYAWGGP